MRVAAAAVAVLLAAVAAAGALLVVAALHGALIGEKLVGGGLSDGMRRNSAIFAALLAAATVVAARAGLATARLARGAAPRPLPEPGTRAARVAAALLCLPALAAGLWVSLLAMLYVGVAAQRPDPDVPDGDPCCGHPDTWGDVARRPRLRIRDHVRLAGARRGGGGALVRSARLGGCPRPLHGVRARRASPRGWVWDSLARCRAAGLCGRSPRWWVPLTTLDAPP